MNITCYFNYFNASLLHKKPSISATEIYIKAASAELFKTYSSKIVP